MSIQDIRDRYERAAAGGDEWYQTDAGKTFNEFSLIDMGLLFEHLDRMARDMHQLAVACQNDEVFGEDSPMRAIIDRYAAIDPPALPDPATLTSAQAIAEGLAIILTYDPNAEIAASHDIIFCGSEDLPIADADLDRLTALRWLISQDSWAHFT